MSARDFQAIHSHGLARVAAATPPGGDRRPARNVQSTIVLAREADEAGVDVVVYPELGISSYAIDDLHLQDALLVAVEAARFRPALVARFRSAPLLRYGAAAAVLWAIALTAVSIAARRRGMTYCGRCV